MRAVNLRELVWTQMQMLKRLVWRQLTSQAERLVFQSQISSEPAYWPQELAS